MNIVFLFIETVLIFLTMYLSYLKYKEEGLYYFIAIASILSALFSLKVVQLFSFETYLDIVLTASILIATNIIIHKKGNEELKKILVTVIVSLISCSIIVYLSSILSSSTLNSINDSIYNYIFTGHIKLYIALLLSTMFSIWFDSILYYLIKKTKNKIWISNILTFIIVEFIDTIIFIVIINILDKRLYEILVLIIVRYLIKVIVGALGTIVIYLCDKVKEEEKDENK